MTSPDALVLPRFKDMHVHLREGSELEQTIPASGLWCDTVLAMPNLKDPLTNPTKINHYWDTIRDHSSTGPMEVIVPLYLTPETTPQDIYRAHGEFGVTCAKIYPKGRTSHSQRGIENFHALDFTYRAMGECGMKLLIHPEHPAYDSWEAEEKFFRQIWPFFRNLVNEDIGLKISLEHLSTQQGVQAVVEAEDGDIVGTITPHHMMAYIGTLVDGLDSAYYCKPVLKQRNDQRVLREAATSGSPFFLLGSDSAPWKEEDKLKRSPCAGCWTAPWLPQLLATVFAEENALDKLQIFTHDNAVGWWGLEPSQKKIRIFPHSTEIPMVLGEYLPFWGGKTLPWGAEPLSS